MIQIFNCRVDIKASKKEDDDIVIYEHIHRWVNSIEEVDRYIELLEEYYRFHYPGDDTIINRVVANPSYVNLSPVNSKKNPICNTNINPIKSILPVLYEYRHKTSYNRL